MMIRIKAISALPSFGHKAMPLLPRLLAIITRPGPIEETHLRDTARSAVAYLTRARHAPLFPLPSEELGWFERMKRRFL